VLENRGLGPAKITRVITALGKCVDSKTASERERLEHRVRIPAAIRENLDQGFIDAVWRTDRALGPEFRFQFPYLDEMILPGHKAQIVAMVPEQIAPLREEMNKIDPMLRWKADARFMDWGLALPLAYEYCSATGRYCNTLRRFEGCS